MRLFAEQLFDDFLHLGHARHAADEDDFVDLGGRDARILQRLFHGRDGLLDKIVHKRFEFRARDLRRQMFRSACVRRDEGQVHFGLHCGGKFDLGFFGGFLQALKRKPVGAQIDAGVFLEFIGEITHDALVEILTAQERVAIGGFHLEHAVADFQHRHVERAAAEVVDGDGAGAFFVHAVSERRCCRLVDDAKNLKPCDAARVFRRLALCVIEIGRHGNDSLRDFLAQMRLGGFLHLLQDETGDFGRCIFLGVAARNPGIAIVGFDDLVRHHAHILLGHGIVEAAADEPLDRKEREFRIGDGLPLGGLAGQSLAVGGEGDDGWRGARAFRILDDFGGRTLHDRHARIGRAEVDAYDFTHDSSSLRATGSWPPKSTLRSVPIDSISKFGGRENPCRT